MDNKYIIACDSKDNIVKIKKDDNFKILSKQLIKDFDIALKNLKEYQENLK